MSHLAERALHLLEIAPRWQRQLAVDLGAHPDRVRVELEPLVAGRAIAATDLETDVYYQRVGQEDLTLEEATDQVRALLGEDAEVVREIHGGRLLGVPVWVARAPAPVRPHPIVTRASGYTLRRMVAELQLRVSP